MVSFFGKHRKKVALLMFINFFISFAAPLKSWAITSGPSQPEMSGFQAIGSSDMVDLFSGDFKYNIPLMDVGGYPLNLAYGAGAGIEDEASWVGFGWSLNPGVINRQMKALPDDFKGEDKVDKTVNIKKKVKVGLSVDFKPDLFGWEGIGVKLKFGVGFKASIYKDNYYGWSADLGINPGIELIKNVAGENTTECTEAKPVTQSLLSAGLNISSSSRDGAGLSPAINFSYIWKKNQTSDRLGMNIGFDYNSRQGMQSQSLGLTYAHTGTASTPKFAKEGEKHEGKMISGGNANQLDGGASYINNGAMTYTPTVDIPRKSDAFTLSIHGGVEWTPLKGVVGAEGSYSAETVPTALRQRSIPAYGFLYEDETNGDPLSESLTDLNREKDIPYFGGVPVIPIPVITNDNFIVNSQNGSGQFKIYRNGSGILHDPYLRTSGISGSAGIDIAGGNIINVGGNIYVSNAVTKTGKWLSSTNNYFDIGKFKSPNKANPLIQNTYFKKSGEMTEADNAQINRLGKDKPIKIGIFGEKGTTTNLTDNYNSYAVTSLEDARREKRTSNFTYLTAQEATVYGLDKQIYSYAPPSSTYDCNLLSNPTGIDRVGIIDLGTSDATRMTYQRRKHHISEISVLDGSGTKMVYGIPVYNLMQEEVTFAVAKSTSLTDKRTGLISYSGTDNSWDNKKGRDNYYSKDVIPSYATSYLLTGILSADYRDRTNNGITDDDYGNAVKFNYTKLNGFFKWRTPYQKDKANYNEGMLGDDWDDKGNYTYGEKEIWYMHSIESKNSVAIFFLCDREDGLGVVDNNGDRDESFRLKKLDRIVLYSKPDFKQNGMNATPIKTVHFEYDYVIGSNYPNYKALSSPCPTTASASTGTGKLTLKKVYFTYGKNQKGKSNPYQFFYKTVCKDANGANIDILNNPAYATRQTDRWGTYKHTDYNPSMLPPTTTPTSDDHFTNAEFPYTIQDRITDEFAGMWNLDHIKLPSGGEINVDYESDDYAYVQNKRAAEMFQVYGVGNSLGDGVFSNNGEDFIDANTICIRSKKFYINPSDLILGMKYLYGKFYIHFFSDVYDYVPGYAEIESVSSDVDSTTIPGEYIYKVRIKKTQAEGLKTSDLVNPFSVGSWQYLRNNLPHRAYPGYDNNTAGDGNVGTNIVGAIRALGNAITGFGELFENYNAKFRRKRYSNDIDPNKSWVRLTDPTARKKGGGYRVKKVTLTDNWANMLDNTADYTNNSYGQIYEYYMKEDGIDISSGVASYEPGMGSDENPFKVPVFYSKDVKWGLDYNTYIEEPIGESYMPSPSVGYRKVTVKSFGATGVSSAAKLGYTVNEYYTAKDFPLIVEKTGPVALSYNPKFILSILGSVVNNSVTVTQGVSVVQNDMHGKSKSEKTYDRNNNLLNSVEYTYQVKDATAEKKQLNNEVDLLRKDGKVSKGLIGQDLEFFTDMRYQETNNTGIRVGIYVGAGFLGIFPTGFGGVNIGANIANSTFRSASAIKIISKYGILQKVTKMVNGSYASTENLMWDPETGDVLLTKTHNEFDQPVYNLTYPAHWAFEMMGPAYQNVGSVLTEISTAASTASLPGLISGGSDKLALLKEGDELIDITTGTSESTYWVVFKNSTPSEKYLINDLGVIQTGLSNKTLKIQRSGFRNVAASGIATVVSLNNPVVNGAINVTSSSRIIDAKAVVYADEWATPVLPVIMSGGDGGDDHCSFECDYLGAGSPINPYFHNLKGLWRPSLSYVYHAKRRNDVPSVSSASSNITKSGEYEVFDPFYDFSATGISSPFPGLSTTLINKWVWSQKPTLFNNRGEEIENMDALNRFSAASYGYNDQLAVAVAKNARALEIKYDGFEDYTETSACCIPHCVGTESLQGFNIKSFLSSSPSPLDHVLVDNSVSHSGKYSLKISETYSVNFKAALALDYNSLENMFQRNSTNLTTYTLNHNELFTKFQPLKGKEYILSFWVKDGHPTTRTPTMTLKIDGSIIDISTDAKWPVVEGWKRIECKFTTGTSIYNPDELLIKMESVASDIYIDDIRVFPADGQMKSYVYDAVSQRLMADLDENNFATFYEYDDEGTLIRVKKETDRGIKTIKESRQYIRKTN